MATPAPPQEDLVELEIAAFMGPHIKRARIALVLTGILYLIGVYLQYDDVKHLRTLVRGDSELAHRIDLAYYFIVATAVVGVSNIILAAIASNKATFAMYIAMGLFAAHSLFSLYIGNAIFMNWQWWLTAIVLGMGFQAAYKANQLRRTRHAGTVY